VEQEYKLGVKLGVRGTPTIFMSDGRMVPGYMPPARLAVELGAGS
jgi:thiol:disulfide interchange protein DsbC